MSVPFELSLYRGKRVLLTGHTGFKGTWMCRILTNAGAELTGYSLPGGREPDFFALSGVSERMNDRRGDVRDLESLRRVFDEARPEIVIHMAAQPIVREGYRKPVETYETNVMGTVNILECVRQSPDVGSFLNVTTDKVYENREWCWGYRETEPLDGFDPYSNSKSCSELVTHCYKNSFFSDAAVAISTARAGNVIGGGDFSVDRIVPDCVRAAIHGESVLLRNPSSVRPYQHVLEPLFAYLMIAAKQMEDKRYAGWYNVGPRETDCFQTGELAALFGKYWGQGFHAECANDAGPHESNFLKLDCSKLEATFGWSPTWDLDAAMKRTVEWYRCWANGESIPACMDREIGEFLEKGKET